MFALLLTPEYAIFSVSFLVMIGIGLIEVVGLGLGHFDLETDLDSGPGGDGIDTAGLLGWLGLKNGLPVLVWLTSLLGCFTISGVAVQQLVTGLFGAPLPWTFAAIAALVVGLGANSFAAAGLGRLLPEYESTIIDTEDLVMRRGTVLEGAARRGHPARAKVVDQHGQAHYVMVEPHHDGDVIAQGETALLVRRTGALFFVQPEDSTNLLRPIQ